MIHPVPGFLYLPFDELMAKLLDRLTGFYEKLELDAVSLQRLNQYGDRAKIYTEQLRADLDKAAEVTVRQIVKQLPREKLSGRTQWDVIQAVRPVLKRRMEVLSNLLSASALQKQNYMLLWDYQDAGFTHYRLLTEGENCDDCNNLEDQLFPISEAQIDNNRYYIARKTVKDFLNDESFCFYCTRKDLIQVNDVVHADLF